MPDTWHPQYAEPLYKMIRFLICHIKDQWPKKASLKNTNMSMMKNTTVIYVQMIRSLCIQLLQEMDTDNINRIQKTARIVLLETNVQRVRTWQKLSNVTYGKSLENMPMRSVILWNGKKFIHREKKPLNEYLRTVKKTMDYVSQG